MKVTLRPFAAILIVCAALMQGCITARHSTSGEMLPAAQAAWQNYAARSFAADSNTGPYRISANLRYSANDQSHRVSSYLWGNGSAGSPYPIRLDLIAGVGNVVAKIREDDTEFIAFNTEEKLAYYSQRNALTLVSFGVPIPLTLSDLVYLLTGRGASILVSAQPENYSVIPTEAKKTEDGFQFTLLRAPLPGYLEISPEGTPLTWTSALEGGWVISFEPENSSPMRPRRLRITHPRGYLAIIVVKDIKYVDVPYSQQQLDLALPPDTGYLSLEDLQ